MSQNDVKLNEIKDFAFLADKSYKTANGKKGQLPKAKDGTITNPATNSSFEVVEQVNDDTTGFSGTVFKDPVSGEYIIAFRGTEMGDGKTDYNDISADLEMVFKRENSQFSAAKSFADEQIKAILANDPNAKINLTGHSLGGSLAQYIAYETGLKATTFNAFGIENILQKLPNFDKEKFENGAKNTTNYINPNDLVSVLATQYGETKMIGFEGSAFEKFLIVASMAGIDEATALNMLKKLVNIKNEHSMEELLKRFNATSEEDFAKLKSYDENGALNPLYDYYDYYKNLTYDKFTGDLKYIGEMLFDKLFGDMLNISLYDPIALDLNNNGKIDTLSLENGVFFDHNGDEIAFKSSWISGGDGILARDINGDKEINSGAELFGNFTRLKNGELAKNGAEAGGITLSEGVMRDGKTITGSNAGASKISA